MEELLKILEEVKKIGEEILEELKKRKRGAWKKRPHRWSRAGLREATLAIVTRGGRYGCRTMLSPRKSLILLWRGLRFGTA
jgi:hypothetical protein